MSVDFSKLRFFNGTRDIDHSEFSSLYTQLEKILRSKLKNFPISLLSICNYVEKNNPKYFSIEVLSIKPHCVRIGFIGVFKKCLYKTRIGRC